MPAENKITNIERDRRVTIVYDLLVLGTSRAQILQYATNKEWNVRTRQIDNYIKQANDHFVKESQSHREAELGKARRRLEDLYQKTMKVQDYQRALAVQREINALFGLYAPEKHELITWEDEIIALLREGKVTSEQVRAEIGNELAENLFKRTGLSIAVSREGE